MSTPAEVVSEAFAQANNYAADAQAQLSVFTDALAADIQSAPTVTIDWASISGSSVSSPSRPASLEEIEDELTFDGDGSIAASKPGDFTATSPTIAIDDFDEPDPTVDFGTAPVLDFGTAPTLSYGDVPTVPDVADITVPDAPTITLPDTPAYLSLTTPTFAGVDLHEDFLTALETPPTLDLVAPTPYTYTPAPQYSSSLLTALQATLTTRLAGGTGLSPAVETALWDRMREREANLAQANMDEATRLSEAAGFPIPSGALAADLRRVQREYYDKVATGSREISIEQAKLEQQNLEKTITSILDLEGKLIDNAYRLEQIAFESAKFVAQNAVEIYNAQVTKFRAMVDSYVAYAGAYKTIIDGELAKVEVYKAQIAGEQAKADTNRTLVMQYEAEVRARLSTVELYRAQVEGSKALMELEGAKLAAVGERIKGYIASVNGETAKVEAYKVTVQAEATKAEAYRAGVDAQLATVKVYEAKAQAFAAKAGAQGEEARAQISFYEAQARAYAAEWDGWRARVLAESERVKAISMKSQASLDGYRADVARYVAVQEANAKSFEASIHQYEAQKNYVLTAAKMNSDIIRANNDSRLEASKVGAQTYAQLAAAAYNMIHAQAQVSASASNNVQYSYSNDTSDQPPAVTAV